MSRTRCARPANCSIAKAFASVSAFSTRILLSCPQKYAALIVHLLSQYADAVPDMVRQFVVYFYRHIRCARTVHLLCSLKDAVTVARWWKSGRHSPRLFV